MNGSSVRRSAHLVVSVFALVVCGFLVHVTRASVAGQFGELEKEGDVYALPNRDHLVILSLGYRAAAADVLFGRTMVAAGVHFVERRVFHHLESYLNGILALDPTYRDVYYYCDSLLNLSTVELPRENLRAARNIIEQGLKRFPDDEQLWMNAGLFAAYLAPQRLPDNEDVAEWRTTGARWLQHACDVWPTSTELPAACFSSTKLLSKFGKTDAAIRALERLLAVTDDPKTRAQAMTELSALTSERVARKRNQAIETLSQLHQEDLPIASRTQYQLLGPRFDPMNCAGLRELSANASCVSSFDRWGEVSSRKLD